MYLGGLRLERLVTVIYSNLLYLHLFRLHVLLKLNLHLLLHRLIWVYFILFALNVLDILFVLAVLVVSLIILLLWYNIKDFNNTFILHNILMLPRHLPFSSRIALRLFLSTMWFIHLIFDSFTFHMFYVFPFISIINDLINLVLMKRISVKRWDFFHWGGRLLVKDKGLLTLVDWTKFIAWWVWLGLLGV